MYLYLYVFNSGKTSGNEYTTLKFAFILTMQGGDARNVLIAQFAAIYRRRSPACPTNFRPSMWCIVFSN
jgi:hypothetical protein